MASHLLTEKKTKGVWRQWDSELERKGGQLDVACDTKVLPGPGAAVVAGAVVGTLVGLGLLAGLVLLYQRQGKVPEEVANDIK